MQIFRFRARIRAFGWRPNKGNGQLGKEIAGELAGKKLAWRDHPNCWRATERWERMGNKNGAFVCGMTIGQSGSWLGGSGREAEDRLGQWVGAAWRLRARDKAVG